MQKSFDEALAELQDKYVKSKGGTMTLEEINEVLELQIAANEEAGEEYYSRTISRLRFRA